MWDSNSFSSLVKEGFLTPYWQMYGELQLESMQGEDFEICQSHDGGEICENPKDYVWVVHIMLVFYLIIGNIMLLNLLIAIFTNVFNSVQEKSMEYWKLEMYRLIREYDLKASLVPPFAVLEYFYRFCKKIWKLTCRKNKENLDDFMMTTLETLRVFEKESLANYLNKVRTEHEHSVEHRVKRMAEKIDRISKYIDQQEELKEIQQDLDWDTVYAENDEPDDAKKSKTKKTVSILISRPSSNIPKEGNKEDEDSDDDDDEDDNDDSDDDEDKDQQGNLSDADLENEMKSINKSKALALPGMPQTTSSGRPLSSNSQHLVSGIATPLASRQHRDAIVCLSRRLDQLQKELTQTQARTEEKIDSAVKQIIKNLQNINKK